MPRAAVLLAGALPLLAVSPISAQSPAAEAPGFKLYVQEPGVYRVSWEDLRAAGLGEEPIESRSLALENRGEPVPIRVEDGGDERFGPGDHLDFLGEHLAGERSFYSDETLLNVYRLSTQLSTEVAGARVTVPGQPAKLRGRMPRDAFRVERHLEQDQLMLRFSVPRDQPSPEAWYWAKLTQLEKDAFTTTIDLGDLDLKSKQPTSLRIELRGWSTQPRRGQKVLADHRVEVFWNDVPVGSGEWDRQDAHVIEIPRLPAKHLRQGSNTLRLVVPVRVPPGAKDPLIDVALLNWVDLVYPRLERFDRPQSRFVVSAPAERPLELTAPAGQSIALYGSGGLYLGLDGLAAKTRGGATRYRFALPAGERELHAVVGAQLLTPRAIERDRASGLRDPQRQADYLMIVHPRLRSAAEPLAEFHRKRGLRVAVVDVDDIYDEFNHGILAAQAIRDFINHAYHHWQPPAPRFVLLVGDASWDVKNVQANDANYADWTYQPGEQSRFVKNRSTPYANVRSPADRNLIPTWHYESSQGHAASDNWLVAVDGDDFLPDLAIGRFPVVEPTEVAAIVRKGIRYAEGAEVGPWRRRILWITNEEVAFQRRSDLLVGEMVGQGFEPLKVYPKPEEPSNEQHQAFLREAFDEGQLLVHFYGHGGRYIWRTGPPDYRKNHDLFTLEDLDKLAPTVNLPVVLSMTCYTSPFDHPTADSIGEKFLRLPGRGAVAVLGASWRSSPSPTFSRALLEALIRPGFTIGEAVLEAKREVKVRHLLEMYNLLGDPALPMAVPQLAVELSRSPEREELVAEVPEPELSGRAVVDWFGEAGEVLGTTELEVGAPRFTIDLSQAAPGAKRLAVYVWNTEKRLDALGRFDLEPEPASEAETSPPVATKATVSSAP